MTSTETWLVENVEHPHMRALKYLFTLHKRVEEIEELVEHGLMYVEPWVNHRAAKNTIVDFGDTHNFMTEFEAKRLNIL